MCARRRCHKVQLDFGLGLQCQPLDGEQAAREIEGDNERETEEGGGVTT